jgi:hypothetical protein
MDQGYRVVLDRRCIARRRLVGAASAGLPLFPSSTEGRRMGRVGARCRSDLGVASFVSAQGRDPAQGGRTVRLAHDRRRVLCRHPASSLPWLAARVRGRDDAHPALVGFGVCCPRHGMRVPDLEARGLAVGQSARPGIRSVQTMRAGSERCGWPVAAFAAQDRGATYRRSPPDQTSPRGGRPSISGRLSGRTALRYLSTRRCRRRRGRESAPALQWQRIRDLCHRAKRRQSRRDRTGSVLLLPDLWLSRETERGQALLRAPLPQVRRSHDARLGAGHHGAARWLSGLSDGPPRFELPAVWRKPSLSPPPGFLNRFAAGP